MRRLVYAALGVAGLVGCGLWIYTQWYKPHHSQWYLQTGVLTPDRPVWVQLPVILVLLLIGLGFLAESCSRNIYRVYDGVVVDREFVPEHTNPSYTYPMLIGKVTIMQTMPATHVPDAYRLKLRRHDGRTGWLAVNKEAYSTPDGRYIDLRPPKKRH